MTDLVRLVSETTALRWDAKTRVWRGACPLCGSEGPNALVVGDTDWGCISCFPRAEDGRSLLTASEWLVRTRGWTPEQAATYLAGLKEKAAPQVEQVMPWGRYKGESVGAVPSSYLLWIISAGRANATPKWLLHRAQVECRRRGLNADVPCEETLAQEIIENGYRKLADRIAADYPDEPERRERLRELVMVVIALREIAGNREGWWAKEGFDAPPVPDYYDRSEDERGPGAAGA